jgi:hypothetical protein
MFADHLPGGDQPVEDPFDSVSVRILDGHIASSLACSLVVVHSCPMDREASCHCGKLTLRCDDEPSKVSLCNCFDCQRRTGSSFSIAAFYPRAKVAILHGNAKTFRRHSASGFDVTFHFCPECGSNLWWEPDRLPNLIGVAAGSFADRDFPMPEQAVWTENQHHWLQLPSGLPSHSHNPVRFPGSRQGQDS